MDFESLHLFKEIDRRVFEWIATQEESIEVLRRLFINASEADEETVDYTEVCTLSASHPVIGREYILTLTQYAGEKPTSIVRWYEYCTIARLSGDIIGNPISAVHTGALTIATACLLHYNDEPFIPHHKWVIGVFPPKPKDKDSTDQNYVVFKLRNENGGDRFNFAHCTDRPLMPGDIIASLWEIGHLPK